MGLIATGQGRRSSSGDGGGGGRRQQRRRRALLPVRMAASGGLVLVALLAVAVAQLQHQWGAHAYTRPDQLQALLVLRNTYINKTSSWAKTLSHWKCPTDPSDSDSACDPCSKDWSGNWEYIHCRGSVGPYGEGSQGSFDGLVTNVHITDQELEGLPPRELCGLQHLRELDLDGSNFNGPFPSWTLTCFSDLQELDLSYNRLTGTIPADVAARVPTLQEFKVEHNEFVGTIPPSMGSMPRLRVIRFEYNHMQGTIPKEFSQLKKNLNTFEIASNDFSGDLMPLAEARPISVTVENNPQLCGMVPAGIRFAAGYNPAGTRLGQPCD
ncbi:hypothetical protein CHLRE_04g227600v5 [Chlamydomonas reinhardtii]|uniref:Leucine-rich repeat-containing N-terminal plant-type domain-containing protein n=1 Tax=Chlamydomonas reinhardtii TaxID=3055 RepID=A0A2K3DUQ8_CHLRE|nr:uncharacterized protein CHLRE_04g227600v5 [Chlamydomonas reinhardtii]PNW84271.1 hypothetical protein CHLRE_04g227600v5 [Chlamydomonas reinhardtii]